MHRTAYRSVSLYTVSDLILHILPPQESEEEEEEEEDEDDEEQEKASSEADSSSEEEDEDEDEDDVSDLPLGLLTWEPRSKMLPLARHVY